MDTIERFQGDSRPVERTGGGAAMQELLRKSSDRLESKKRLVHSVAQEDHSMSRKNPRVERVPPPPPPPKKIAPTPRPQREPETPEERLARKAALKLARNKKRLEADSAEVVAASGADRPKDPAEVAAVLPSNNQEEAQLPIVQPESTGEKIIQQLFPTGISYAKSIDTNKLKSNDIEAEDVADATFVADDSLRLPMRESISQWGVSETIVDRLDEMGYREFFPVQAAVIPALLRLNALDCIKPREVCVAAATGSGMFHKLYLLKIIFLRRKNACICCSDHADVA
jgi:hypothetical protein